jgi:hypothetical protein
MKKRHFISRIPKNKAANLGQTIADNRININMAIFRAVGIFEGAPASKARIEQKMHCKRMAWGEERGKGGLDIRRTRYRNNAP